ncbi:MAG: methyltransferase domain-containing protein [Candidatus Heimdallarchaeota archaeon]|nr:methyltransferase domain-containing protein [Candidatus Heimdallarchaeota archaeon]
MGNRNYGGLFLLDEKNSNNLGWRWNKVTDLEGWQKPDGFVVNFVFSLDQDPSTKIYDLGCGIGRHTIFFASQGYQVAASDISTQAVERTKDWLEKLGLSADVQQGCMTDIHQPDNEFDLVISINVIYHAYKRDIIKTISEIYRILKPSGEFYCTLKTLDEDTAFDQEYQMVEDQTFILKGGVEKDIPHFLSTKKDVLEFFEDFEILHIVYAELYKQPFDKKHFVERKGRGYFRVHVRKPQ